MRLEDKVALVTGGGAGIGRAIGIEFAREGAKVLVAELDETNGQAVVDEITAAAGQAQFQRCDVTNEDEVKAVIKAAVDAFGRLDVMVNNAGVSEMDWDTMLAVNLSGVYYGCKLAAETMAAQGHGVIINMSSIAGLVGLGKPEYVATKHGVLGLTRSFAINYAQRGVRVNCINPGFIETPMTAEIKEDPAIEEPLLKLTPIGRWGRPEEIAKAALFLASDDSSFMTGAPLIVDCGLTAK